MEINPLYIILPFVGIITGIINVLAGGGSMINLPLMIFFGIPATVANGTNRLAVFCHTLSSVHSFHKKKVSFFKDSARFFLPGVIGAIIGSSFAVDIKDHTFERILGVVMICLSFVIIFDPLKKVYSKKEPHPAILFILYILVGFYLGLIQVGVGFITIFILHGLVGYDLVKTNAIKMFLGFFFNLISLGFFIFHSKVDWQAGLILGISMAIGARIGTHLAVHKSDKWIKAVLVTMILIFSLKLII